MYYRLATLKSEETFTEDTTKVIDIDVVDPISQIIIRFQPKNGVEGDSTAHLMNCLSKVELVDGSDVIFSLSGPEAAALDYYSFQKERTNIMWYNPNMVQDLALHISFGRSLWDTQLALDPKKFTNLQLKITLDIDGGGMNTSQVVLSVFAHLFDEKAITPIGFLMSKEIKDYALGAGTHEYTDLPTDHAYRKIFFRVQKDANGTEHCFRDIKLSQDFDKKVPLNQDIGEILHAITSQVKPYREWIIVAGGAQQRYFHITPAYWPNMSVSHWEASAIPQHATIWEGGGQRAQLFTDGVGGNYSVLVEGWCPHGVVEIPFGLQDDIEDWYSVADITTLRLDILSGPYMTTSDTCQVFMQQFRKYVA